MSGYLVGSAAFKAVGTGDPRPAGSIPVHLRQWVHGCPLVCFESPIRWGYSKFDPRTFVAVCGALLSHQMSRAAWREHPYSSASVSLRHSSVGAPSRADGLRGNQRRWNQRRRKSTTSLMLSDHSMRAPDSATSDSHH